MRTGAGGIFPERDWPDPDGWNEATRLSWRMLSGFFADSAVQAALLLLGVTFLADWLLRRLMKQWLKEPAPGAAPRGRSWRHGLLVLSPPLRLLIWYYGAYLAARVLVAYSLQKEWNRWGSWVPNVAGAGVFFASLWMLHRSARVVDARLRTVATTTPGAFDDIFLPLLGLAFRIVLPVVALFFLVHLWPFSPGTLALLHKLIAVALILALAWLIVRASGVVEQVVLGRKELKSVTNYEGRALVTRVSLLRKIAMVFVGVFALAAVLMLFDEVRDVGRSILASAGVAGIILGLAAQRSLGGLFAGLQIALTQPVRIGDQIKMEDEAGAVEEITLTYVVVRRWDRSCLIVPITHFIENPVVNYTRGSSAVLAQVLLRADFSLPVPPLREYVEGLVRQSPLWDQKTLAVQTTDVRHESMEIRILIGAPTGASAFQLQCELREKAVEFLHLHYPQCLPKAREEGKPITTWKESEEFGARAPDPGK